MAKLTYKNIKGKKYAYLEKSFRVKDAVRKLSKYLGPENTLTKSKLKQAEKEFDNESLQKEAKLRVNYYLKNIKKLEYPLTVEEIEKIEFMNLKYKHIIKNLHPKNIEDINKRFVANYVFETNALEGNSLTLKNVAEVVFENRISKGKDLREIYDAQNSYKTFLFLQNKRENLSYELIINLHKRLMKNIDDRLGYRTLPVTLIGQPLTKLSKPEHVKRDMNKLLEWYEKNENKLYPLELAFKFHAKFEKIHPFCDGNGRVGRLLLNYILMKNRYFPVIIRKTNRNSYIKALDAADREKWLVLMRFALKRYKETFKKFFEIYYKYS